MAFRSARAWCYICRDEKPDVTCKSYQTADLKRHETSVYGICWLHLTLILIFVKGTGKRCKKSFHWDCLRNTGQLHEDDEMTSNYLVRRSKINVSVLVVKTVLFLRCLSAHDAEKMKRTTRFVIYVSPRARKTRRC